MLNNNCELTLWAPVRSAMCVMPLSIADLAMEADSVPANRPRKTTPANCQTNPTTRPRLVTGVLSP